MKNPMQTLATISNTAHQASLAEQFVLRTIAYSPFAERLLNQHAELLADLLENLTKSYLLSDMQVFLQSENIFDETSLKKALRQLRQRVMLRMMTRDLNGLVDSGADSSVANLNEVMLTTSHLAEVSLQCAVDYLTTWQTAEYGTPVDVQGHAQQLVVVGMGKLGGLELNVSSDIDLIFAYDEEGETNGEKSISNQEFFTRLAKKLITAIDEVTPDGFVFRVDMRLRPYGGEGVLVSSLDALADYYQNNGREWERYAWIKGRVVVGDSTKLNQLLKPFVFRKYLDFGAFASMRELKAQIQHDVVQKRMQDNIKLGRGGIREIEFIAQVFQLIRGGQDTSLQIKSTLSVLALLQNKALLSATVVDELSTAYVFLRHCEHRLMYVEDQQTQDLPKQDEAKIRLAKAMNFSDWASFYAQLEHHRINVQRHFDAVFQISQSIQHSLIEATAPSTPSAQSKSENVKALWQALADLKRTGLQAIETQQVEQALQLLGYQDAKESLRRLQSLTASAKYQQLPVLSIQRFNAVMPSVIELAADENNPDITLLRMIDLLSSICRRASYLALLTEYPAALRLVTKLTSASPWLANYLTQHPILLDELLDTNSLYAAPNFVAMQADLLAKLNEAHGDVERQMDITRHFKHAATFRFAAQDVLGALSVERLSDYLSQLADLILQTSLQVIWRNLNVTLVALPKFAIIGYGKLGGMELGYASDLDIIFLYDKNSNDDAESNTTQSNGADIYARLAQRINNWFNSLTSAGLLYEIDLQLRPDGNSGLLVSSVDAFREYQLKKAWVWEHQAITRARFVAGDISIGAIFEQIRVEVITQTRDSEKLQIEVLNMRDKMRAANKTKLLANHTQADEFDLKHSAGGIVDVEFLVQFLVLKYAAQYPQLSENIGNIALLDMCASLGLIDANLALQVANAYREYRRLQHGIRLQGIAQAKVEVSQVFNHAEAVKALWQSVFITP